MTPEQILALLRLIATQEIVIGQQHQRVVELEHHVAELEERLAAATPEDE